MMQQVEQVLHPDTTQDYTQMPKKLKVGRSQAIPISRMNLEVEDPWLNRLFFASTMLFGKIDLGRRPQTPLDGLEFRLSDLCKTIFKESRCQSVLEKHQKLLARGL